MSITGTYQFLAHLGSEPFARTPRDRLNKLSLSHEQVIVGFMKFVTEFSALGRGKRSSSSSNSSNKSGFRRILAFSSTRGHD